MGALDGFVMGGAGLVGNGKGGGGGSMREVVGRIYKSKLITRQIVTPVTS